MTLPAREFGIWTSDKSYRYKEEAIVNHAPPRPGIYSIVRFDEAGAGRTLFLADSGDTPVDRALWEHWEGVRKPPIQELLQRYGGVYFMFVEKSDAETPEDRQDLLYALARQEQPELQDWKAFPNSGRYEHITVRDHSLL